MDASLYAQFARLEDSHWWFRGRAAVAREVLRRWLPRPPPLRLLDLGSGTGGMLRMLREFGDVEGLEAHPEAVRLSRLRVPEAQVRLGELPAGLPAQGEYDVITAFDVLEHLDEPVRTLREAARLLARSGVLIATVPAYQFLWSEHDELNHHRRRYTRGQLVDDLTQAGLEVRHVSYFNSALFAPVAAVRLLKRFLPSRSKAEAETDLRPVTSPINWALERLFAAERWVVPRMSLPFGVSLVAVARARS